MILKRINDVNIYSFKISEEVTNKNKLLDLLSKDEISKANRFRFEKDRTCYILCRGFLRILLNSYLSIKPKNIIFEYNSYGKPELSQFQNSKNIKFNISHSEDYFLIAITEKYDIGIDIEKIKKIDDFMIIAESVFSDAEYNLLKKTPCNKQLKSFYSIWSQKEALIKASGKGVSFGLAHWSTTLDIEKQNIKIDDQEYMLILFFVDNEYSSSVCIKNLFFDIDDSLL